MRRLRRRRCRRRPGARPYAPAGDQPPERTAGAATPRLGSSVASCAGDRRAPRRPGPRGSRAASEGDRRPHRRVRVHHASGLQRVKQRARSLADLSSLARDAPMSPSIDSTPGVARAVHSNECGALTVRHPNMEGAAGTSYRHILRSTVIMGGSSVVSILLGIVRTKVLALLIGPAGIGLAGLYLSTTNLVAAIFGMGIGESAVRSIAASAEMEDRRSISRTASTVRRASLLCGIAGLSFVLLFSPTLSRWTFGDAGHTSDLALLSLTVVFAAVAGG